MTIQRKEEEINDLVKLCTKTKLRSSSPAKR